MPFEESNSFSTWQFNLITNRHKISGAKYVPSQRRQSTKPADELSLSHSHFERNTKESVLRNISSTASRNWREFDIVSNDYCQRGAEKRRQDRLYEFRKSKQRLYATNPYDPVLAKWKAPRKERVNERKEERETKLRMEQWNEQKQNNFIHHPIVHKQRSSKKPKQYPTAKHPEVYHRIDSVNTIKPRQRINPQVYERPLRRNHHIITNQPWKGTQSVDFPLGKGLRLKHRDLWKS